MATATHSMRPAAIPTALCRSASTALAPVGDMNAPASPTRCAFAEMVARLERLIEVEEDNVDPWAFYPALDLDEATHAHASLDAAAEAVCMTQPVSTGDRALQIGATMLRAVIGCEAAMDREMILELIKAGQPRLLLLPSGDPEAQAVNPVLRLAFARLGRLVMLMGEGAEVDMPLTPVRGFEPGPGAAGLSL